MYIHIGALRRVLEPEPDGSQPVLVSSGTGYLLRLAPDQLDLAVFGNHLERARRLRADGALGPAVEELDAALALWQGTPLAGVSSPVAEAQRLRLTEQRLTAVEDRAEALLELGQHAALVAELSALAEEHPLRERPRTLLMLAMYRAGRQADALAVYRDTHRMLVEELGIEPGPQLRRVHREIASNRDAKLVKPADMRQGPRDADPFVPRQLPPAVRHFAGRSTELQSLTGVLDEAVATGNTVVISAIDGTAGIGKTALAVLWAHRVAARFPDGQLYVNLRGFDPADAPMAPADALRGFLEALQVPRDRIPAGFDAQVDLYRSLLAGRRVLIVLDNARDVEQVRPLLPGTVGCLALVTSRNRLTGLVTGDVTGDGAYAITLGLLTAAEARELLTRHLGAARGAAEAAAADQLIDDCARLPLALSIVAARAATRPRTSPPRPPPASPRSLSQTPPGSSPSWPPRASSMSTHPVGSPFTTCCAPTPPSKRTPLTPTPTGGRRSCGCSTTTCTPRSPATGCSIHSAIRSRWSRLALGSPRRRPPTRTTLWPGSPPNTRSCSPLSGTPPTPGWTRTPDSSPGPTRRS